MTKRNGISLCALMALLLIPGYADSESESIIDLNGKGVPAREIEQSVRREMQESGITGLSMAVINDSRVVHARAYGYKNKRQGTLMNEETVLAAASLSKPVFAYLVMILVDERVIDVDKPLYQYLEKPIEECAGWNELKADERYKQITARMALSHSTGFPNLRIFMPDKRLAILFDPGSRFQYSGEGMQFLQSVIEEITGKDLQQLAVQKVFTPLQMTRSSYVWDERFADNCADRHDAVENWYRLRRQGEARAGGSMVTTAGDYGKFLVAVLRGTGLSKPAREQMLTPQIAISSTSMFGPGSWDDRDKFKSIHLSWGLGFGRFDTTAGRAFFHTGHDSGAQNYAVAYADKGTGIVLLSNSDNFEGAAAKILKAVIDDVYTPVDWLGYVPHDAAKPKPVPRKRIPATINTQIYEEYTGDYSFETGKRIRVRSEDSRLLASLDGSTWHALLPYSEEEYFIEGESEEFSFRKDDKGHVTHFVIHVFEVEIPCRKME